jgi:glycosyltransferase involved in cell wall biosynthesis
MHLILLHGYLLQGTGSNIYVANIAKAWQGQGHAVTVVCQDYEAKSLTFVDHYIGPGETIPSDPPEPGSLRVIVPDINRLLPVYVFDHYEGFRVKTIPEMTVDECETHIEMTAAVLRSVVAQGCSHVLANHALFGPIIASRALTDTAIPYDVKIHGSALEYTLVPHPEWMLYAVEGLKGARHIFVGTRYVKHRTLEVFASYRNQLALEDKLHIVPPGMDPEIFKLSESYESGMDRFLENVDNMIQENGNGRQAFQIALPYDGNNRSHHELLLRAGERYNQRAVDADLPAKWPRIESHEPIILYFGKFLPAKGVGEVLVTVPTVLSKIPSVRFVFVGFGSYREHLEGMLQGLIHGDSDMFKACARAGDFVEVKHLDHWFRPLTSQESDRITMTGILDHETLGSLLPLASLTIVPSKWPEAFGMVAVEAMAAGVLPLCNDHAGLRDVIEAVGADSPEIADLMRLDRAEFVTQLPEKINSALNFLYPDGYAEQTHRKMVSRLLRRISVKHFSWDRIAKMLIDL